MMTNATYTEELGFIKEQMKAAVNQFNTIQQINHKDTFDLVTDVDIAVETFLTEQIHAHFPCDRILAEELHKSNSWEGRVWTIDPIDGTVNFANSMPIYGIQASLVEDGDIKMGVIYLPVYDTFYWAIKGEGSYRNGERIHTSSIEQLEDTIVSFGDFSHTCKAWNDYEHALIRILPDKVAKVRFFGAACFDFAMLSIGATGAHIMFTTNAWDIYPGLIIALEAGAVATNLKGGDYNREDGNLLVACNKQISQKLLSLIINKIGYQ